MNMMKAAAVHSFGRALRIEEVAVPETTPGQVLVNVVAPGVCHTDLHAADGDWPAINARVQDPAVEVQRTIRGAHGVLVTAVARSAFAQALGMLHKRDTMSLVGLPPGDFALPIFDVVLNAKTVRGSIVGTRMDLQEAVAFAAEGKVRGVYSEDRLDNINAIFTRMKQGDIEGRIVMRIAADA